MDEFPQSENFAGVTSLRRFSSRVLDLVPVQCTLYAQSL